MGWTLTEALHSRSFEPAEAEAEPDRSGEAIDRLLGEIGLGANSPEGRAAADRLRPALERLAADAPTEETRARLQRILDEKTLDRFTDSSGLPSRAAVINAQLALGYPWALEVSPTELEWLRSATAARDARVTRARRWPVVFGLPSLAWNGAWAALTVETNGWFAAPFVVGAIHAAGALTASVLAREVESPEQRREAARRYRWLAQAWWCGPVFSGIAAAAAGSAWSFFLVLGPLFAFPAMLTAWSCFAASHRLLPGKPSSE